MCSDFGITQLFSSVSHPQSNGQVELTNRIILHGLKTRIEASRSEWLEQLPHVIWAYRTTPKESTGETPFGLTYGCEAVIPAEIGIPTSRVHLFQEESNEESLRLSLDEVEERRDQSYIRQAKYKQEMKKYHDQRVRLKGFKVDDWVLRRNEVSHAEPGGKLSPNWEGPYRVVQVGNNGSYNLAKADGTLLPRTWNAEHLRKYYF